MVNFDWAAPSLREASGRRAVTRVARVMSSEIAGSCVANVLKPRASAQLMTDHVHAIRIAGRSIRADVRHAGRRGSGMVVTRRRIG